MKDWKKLLLDPNRMTGAAKAIALVHNALVRDIYDPPKKEPAKKEPAS